MDIFDEHAKVLKKMFDNKKAQKEIIEKMGNGINSELENQLQTLKKEYYVLSKLERTYDNRYEFN
ncbi:hypothetical protein QUF94_17860 [Peribacillus sp. NJ4]|uniref:hypothetical protein n=1 Tax=Peribacillus TaxID=2675229 RepID=UPI0025A263E0|nr:MULTISPECIES: hypothetical protein [unclassified Peribacillus]MDM5213264.1 hypothetical protein [Peribacillus sp. NJ4]MDM5223643.1 hypothetical protein [Peribacillus sp. NJ11]